MVLICLQMYNNIFKLAKKYQQKYKKISSRGVNVLNCNFLVIRLLVFLLY